jgi:peptidoglycan/LPS O-acetylase OafA/YrhL
LLFAAVAMTMGLGAGGFLVNPVIRHIGNVSFSAYLIHFSLLGPVTALAHALGVEGAWGLAVVLPALVLATTIIATVTYLLIEQPAINFGRRVVKWRSQRGAGSASSSKFCGRDGRSERPRKRAAVDHEVLAPSTGTRRP